MDQYQVTITGLTPLLMHKDNLAFSEKITAWQRDPANKANSQAGDDRTPPWKWIGCLYHNGRILGMDSDCIMTTLREGGAKVLTGKGKETFKKQTQSGIMLDRQQFDLYLNGATIPVDDIEKLIGDLDFNNHLDLVESLGFELLIKRAKIGRSKHIRVRPMFREWELRGSLTVIDKELSGITGDILATIFTQSGSLCGLGDWRPNSPSSGTFGKFEANIKKI